MSQFEGVSLRSSVHSLRTLRYKGCFQRRDRRGTRDSRHDLPVWSQEPDRSAVYVVL